MTGKTLWQRALVGLSAMLTAVALVIAGPIFGGGGGGGVTATAENEVRAYVEQRNGQYGIALHNLEDDTAAGLNANSQFRIASMYKLFVLYRVIKAIEEGQMAPDTPVTIQIEDAKEGDPLDGLRVGQTVTVDEALEKMIAVSSNNAAYALARNVGGWDEVRAVPKTLGLRQTRFDEYWWSSPNDIKDFYRRLARGELVSEEASAKMRDLLERQSRRDRIPALLPEVVTVAHKTGELDGVRNDGGIIKGPGVEYVLVMMTRDTDPTTAVETEAEVSRIVYEVFSSEAAGQAQASSGG